MFIVRGTILSVFMFGRKKTIHGKSSIMLMAKVFTVKKKGMEEQHDHFHKLFRITR
jgi:hypothetical protein